MKKLFAILSICLGLAACGGVENDEAPPTSSTESASYSQNLKNMCYSGHHCCESRPTSNPSCMTGTLFCDVCRSPAYCICAD